LLLLTELVCRCRELGDVVGVKLAAAVHVERLELLLEKMDDIFVHLAHLLEVEKDELTSDGRRHTQWSSR
jgi:hypothetical protein